LIGWSDNVHIKPEHVRIVLDCTADKHIFLHGQRYGVFDQSGGNARSGEQYAADQIGVSGWDVENPIEEDRRLFPVTTAFYANDSATYGNRSNVAAEASNGEWFDLLILFERGSIVEDVPIGS
jgi:hypothetical protein